MSTDFNDRGKISPEAIPEEEDAQLWQFDPNPSATEHESPAWKFESQINKAKEEADDNSLTLVEADQSPELISFPFDPNGLSTVSKALYLAELKTLNAVDTFKNAIHQEREFGSLFNFVPVCVALGIVAYFSVPNEPSFIAVISACAIAAVFAVRIQTRGLQFVFCVSVALIFAGMLVAQMQVLLANTPVPRSEITGQLRGIILSVDQNQRGAPRYLIRPVDIEGLYKVELPKTVRLSASKKHSPFKVGDTIHGLARLAPISGPAYPGGYDFSFPRWMQGLGLSGFFMGAPSLAETPIQRTFGENLKIGIQTARQSIATRIRAGLPGEAGDIATALITGDRSGLSNETQEALRRSGLAHILAISGLHMALVTLTVIWIARLLLVLIPGFSEKTQIKKWAIGAGFLTATLYMAISGASIATQRAWLMISVMLVASLMDRRAITMRSVTIAALIILVLDPASLFQPGFQMSFAAVAALVVVYQDWTHWQRKRLANRTQLMPQGGVIGAIRAVTRYFAGLSATSLIAGFATALFALWHFHRVAPLGLVSNLIAMPLVSMFVMPLSLLSMFLMPYGFESFALAPLGVAIDKVVEVANYVNSYEFDFETGYRPKSFLIASAAFLIFVTFLKTRLRWLAVFPLIAIGMIANIQQPIPDILVAQDGRNIAIRSNLLENGQADNGLTLLYPGRGKFITDIWQRAFIPNQDFDRQGEEKLCGKDICSLKLATKQLIVVYDPKLIPEACLNADILIAPRLWWTNCRDRKPELTLNRTNLETNGAHTLYNIKETLKIVTAWPAEVEGLPRRAWINRFDNVSRRYKSSQNLIKNEGS